MRLLTFEKSLAERETDLVVSSLALSGIRGCTVRSVDELVRFSRPGNLTFEQIITLACHKNAISFVGECLSAHLAVLNGDIVMSLVNFMMRSISLTGAFVKQGTDLLKVRNKLTQVCNIRVSNSTVWEEMCVLLDELCADELDFLVYDSYFLHYLIASFYIAMSTKSVCVFEDTREEPATLYEEFIEFVNSRGAF